jgi:phosphoglycolate phosphatase-like HAD superfamily hydrolase
VEPVRAVAVDLEALGNTRGLWRDFLVEVARRFDSIASLDPEALPRDRAAAAEELDRWASHGVGDWRGALRRFAEERAPVYLRPDAEAAATLRALARAGIRVGVHTDAPAELAQVALAHLGAARRVEAVESGRGARERLLARLGADTAFAASLEELAKISGDA